jgi:hypothetical protein
MNNPEKIVCRINYFALDSPIQFIKKYSLKALKKVFFRFGFMVFNTTFNNISVISWRSVLLVEEPGRPG